MSAEGWRCCSLRNPGGIRLGRKGGRIIHESARTQSKTVAKQAECCKTGSAYYTAVVLALNTAMRKGEIRNLRWSQVDLFQGVLTVGKSKTEAGTGRVIPLNATAVRVLAGWGSRLANRQPGHHAYPWCEHKQVDPSRPTKGWRTAWRNACKRVGLKVRFHDLRHTAITKLTESQASDQTIMSIAGHVSRQVLEHYSHIRMAAKRTALDSIPPPASACLWKRTRF